MKKVISLLLLLLLYFPAHSQAQSLTDSQIAQQSDEVRINFDSNSYVIDLDLHHNRESLLRLSDLIETLNRDTLTVISKIEINSYTSPEGDSYYNNKLSERRSNSIYDYLTNTISVPDSLISQRYLGTDWDRLQEFVEESDMQYRDEVLSVLRSVPEETWQKANHNDRWLSLVDSRNKHLMDLKYGNPYRYIYANYYPLLRVGSVVTIYFKTTIQPIIEEITDDVDETINAIEIAPISEPIETIADNSDADEKRSIKVALKTNLLYDMLLIPSLEVEVPIGKHWSVAGEWIFPWWTTKDNAYALQILSGQVEGRYWFGNRTNRPQLTGWFAGLYAGGGLYDLQWDGSGYQGEFFIASGLSGGFAHTINKSGSLRMEYSLGFGYLKTNYRHYKGMQNNEYLVWQYDGNYTWFGPTKAKISLVWMIGNKGGKR